MQSVFFQNFNYNNFLGILGIEPRLGAFSAGENPSPTPVISISLQIC